MEVQMTLAWEKSLRTLVENGGPVSRSVKRNCARILLPTLAS